MCAKARVRLFKLAPYSPNINLIKEFFIKVKTYIKQQRHNHADLFKSDFKTFLRMYIDIVGSRTESAEGHFCYSSIFIKYPSEHPFE